MSRDPDDGLSKVYSPVNQAWLVMWNESVLRIFNDEADADAYIDYLRSGKTYGPGAVWRWPEPGKNTTNGLDGAYEDYGAREPPQTDADVPSVFIDLTRAKLRQEYTGTPTLTEWMKAWNEWYDASYALCSFLAGGWRGPCFPDLLIYALADEGIQLPGVIGSFDPEQTRRDLMITAQLWLPGFVDELERLVEFVETEPHLSEYMGLAQGYLDAQQSFAEIHESIREAVEALDSFPPQERANWDPIYEIHLLAIGA